MSANRDGWSRGRYPSFPHIHGVRDTTRRVAASFNPTTVHTTRLVASIGAPAPMNTQDEVDHIVEDPEERPTLLTRIASERPNPLADLDSLLPVSHVFNDEVGFMALCNDLIVLNAQQHRDPGKRSINIPGTKVRISPFQFYHAFHLLSQRGRDLNGGILADEPGTGKTHIFFAACLIRALAFESERMVRLYWSGKGRKKLGRHAEQHLPEGANGRSCPSQKQGQLVCYCVPGSLTRTICESTPNGVSALYCSNESWPDILNLVQSAALNPSIYQLSLVHSNAPARFTRTLTPLVKTLSRGVQPDLRDFSPASHIFITTVNSPRLRNVFSEATLNAGFVVIDEAHQVLRTRESLMFRMVSEFSGNGADVWFVTATPFNGCTLADWIPPMELIAPGRADAMQGLMTDLDYARSSGDPYDEQAFQNLFRRVFDEKLVLRHFGTSTFFGKAISHVQDIQPRVISRHTPLQHRSAVQELASQIAFKDPQLQDARHRGLLYLVSLFPAAAQLIMDDPITFDMAAIRDLVRQVKNRLHIEESEPLRRLADQIVRGSPKVDYILEELRRMDSDKRERERVEARSSSTLGAGEDFQMKKMVIITPTVVSAVFLYLALTRHRKDAVLIHNWISSQEKEQVVNNFMSLSAAKLVKHNRVLIAPMAAAGTGVNLQAASYQILTSPFPDRASQLQAFARTNRSGQRLRPLSHRILVLEDSPVDRIMLASQATLDIQSDPFRINEPLRVAGYSSLSSTEVSPGPVAEDLSLSSSESSTLGVEDAAVSQNAMSFPPAPFQNAMSLPPAPPVIEGPSLSSSESSTFGVGDPALFQNAVSFPPVLHANHEDQQGDEERESSAMDVEGALLLQTALTFSIEPTLDDDDDEVMASEEQRSQADTYSLFRDSPVGSSTGPRDETGTPQGPRAAEPRQSLQQSNTSSVGHWNLTYTLAPLQPLWSGAKNVSHRPLRPPPTDAQTGTGSRHQLRSLHLPLMQSPPARIDAVPALASPRRNRSTLPASRYQVDVDQGRSEIRVTDSTSFSAQTGVNRPLEPVSLTLSSDFTPSLSNIVGVVDRIRQGNGQPRRAEVVTSGSIEGGLPSPVSEEYYASVEESPARPISPLSSTERAPWPIHGQRPREYVSSIPDHQDLASRNYSITDLMRAADRRAQIDAYARRVRLARENWAAAQQGTGVLDSPPVRPSVFRRLSPAQSGVLRGLFPARDNKNMETTTSSAKTWQTRVSL